MSKSLFNEIEKEFILNNYKEISSEELANLFNKKFDRNITSKQMRMYKQHHKLRSGYDGSKSLFNEIERKFILDNYKGISSEKLTNLFNKKFSRNITEEQIQLYKKSHRLRSGYDAKFKKAQTPHNQMPIGSETIYYDKGIKKTYIKIGEPNIWERKQVYLYKKYKGDVPDDGIVIFLDGNKDNFDIDNLELITRHENNIIAGNKFWCNNKEVNKAIIELSRLKAKAKEMEEC